MLIYYVYAYLRSDGTPYYIGKGKGKRSHSKYHTVHLPRDKTRIVFLEKNLTNVGACALERRYIRWYGRLVDGTGTLRNITVGGEGNTGPRSKEWCRRQSLVMKGRKRSQSVIDAMRSYDKSYMQSSSYKNCSK